MSDDPPARFARRLAVIVVGAALLRLLIAWYYDSHLVLGGDAVWYVGIARQLPRGFGFVEPLNLVAAHRSVESAAHPPLYALFLSVMDFAGAHSLMAHRVWSIVPGLGSVVLLGMTGRDLAGDRAGLLAAGIGALYLPLAAQDVVLWSEGLYACTLVFAVWAAYRQLRSPSLGRALVLGVAIGLAALTRAEAVLLIPVLLIPVAWRRGRSVRDVLTTTAVAGIAFVVVIAPWAAYNQGRFSHPVVLSNGLGPLLGSSNCPTTYEGEEIGGWGFVCARGLPHPLPDDESEFEIVMRRAGIDYARDHASQVPAVLGFRLLRTFGLWKPVSLTNYDLGFFGAGLGWAGTVAVAEYWLLLVPAGFGLVGLRRRRESLVPVLAPIVVTVAITLLGYGTVRFRIGFDVVLPLLAAVGIVGWWERGRPRAPGADAPEVPVAPEVPEASEVSASRARVVSGD